MIILKITAAVNSGNETVFNVIDSDGNAVDLTALGATKVTVEVCGPLIPCGSVKIDSSTDDVDFQNDTVTVKFGKLPLPVSKSLYFPKISYITASDDEPEVIAGQNYETEIQLTMVC